VRLSRLLGSKVIDNRGDSRGYVFDVHVSRDRDSQRLVVDALEYGSLGVLGRLGIYRPDAGQTIAFDRVAEVGEGVIRLRD
jgi:sporulation protein YlmC with PRC-barrel domain